ncbi:hypothetical protein Bbelb_213310 [Branchiostoma belcheri]|nr:hypothetical protein Bbelb_213310 [Branchiostoma belcheri]
MGPLLPILLCAIFAYPAACSGDLNKGPEPSLQDALDALGRVLGYCERNYRVLNLDAVIGIRMVDGQLTVLSRRIAAGRLPADPAQSRRVVELQRQAARVADLTLPQLQKTDPDYYKRLSPILQPGFWVIDSRSKTTDPRLLAPPTTPRDTPFNEEQSDGCLTELLGTNAKTSCSISPSCWSLMTSPGYRGYWLTHELFYLQIGEQAGCSHELAIRAAESGRRDGVGGMEAEYCANILREARDLAAAGFRQEGRDLFMEQALLCGLVGYRDFFRSSWLSAILSWQSPSGCFGYQATMESGQNRRVRRREKILSGRCLSHKTGVAAGALAGYVRYILEYYRDLSQETAGTH